MSKILITGIRGVVGSRLATILRERGHEVFGIDLIHSKDDNYQRCDIADYRQLEEIFKNKFDFVYNTAGEFGRWNGEDYYEQLWRTNAVGTKNLIRLQEIHRFKLIHFSSSEVYGDYQGLMSEDVMDKFPIRQMNDYAMTKWVNEMQIRNSEIEHKTETVIVRLFNLYGPKESYHPYRSVNSRFVSSALNNLPITVYKGHLRTSTFIDDACNTLANILDNFKAGEVYNIGGSEEHDIETLADIIWDYTGADRGLITYKESEPLTTKVKHVDISKSIRDLKHENKTSLKDGIIKTIEWMKNA